ncbi:hypothetical protein [Avibacterium avium]|uniref:hypothetical protein n=1 Tax=Avibacterium avium TaxID=751 RepID=UPI003BF86343
MAHQKLGNGSDTEIESDIAVVSPVNMGKGLLWDNSTGKYNIDINSQLLEVDDKTGQLTIRVSKLEDNLLQVHKDGIYVGSKSPKEVEVLYVDSVNGVDQSPYEIEGAGTINKPLRTIKYANSFAVKGTYREIHLHTEQEHICSSSDEFFVRPGHLSIFPYGGAFDAAMERAGGDITTATSIVARESTAPIVKFTGVVMKLTPPSTKEASYVYMPCISLSNGCKVNFYGINLCNDLNVQIRKHPEAKSNVVKYGSLSRILQRDGVNVGLFQCRLSCVGNMTFKDTEEFTLEKSRKLVEGNQISITGFLHPQGGEINILNSFIESNVACHIIAHQGWDQRINNLLSISLGQNADPVERFTKRVYGAVIDEQNGVKQLLAPTSDVSPTKW